MRCSFHRCRCHQGVPVTVGIQSTQARSPALPPRRTGDVYVGDWDNDQRHGHGSFTFGMAGQTDGDGDGTSEREGGGGELDGGGAEQHTDQNRGGAPAYFDLMTGALSDAAGEAGPDASRSGPRTGSNANGNGNAGSGAESGANVGERPRSLGSGSKRRATAVYEGQYVRGESFSGWVYIQKLRIHNIVV